MVLSSFPSKFCFLLGIRFVFIRLGYGLWVKKPPQVSSLQDTWRSLCSGISFDFQEIWLHSNASPSQGMLNQVTLWGFDASFNPSFEPEFPRTEGTLHDGDWTQPDLSGTCPKAGIHKKEIPEGGILRGAEIPMPISLSLAPHGCRAFQQHI